jgi:ankyrin repeat protein
VQILLDRGADADSLDSSGRAPLSWALDKGHKAIVQILLDRQARVDGKDSSS